MAVKGKNPERVDPANKVRLDLLLRDLQTMTSTGFSDKKACERFVQHLGSIEIPKDPQTYPQFIAKVQAFQETLSKEYSNKELFLVTLKAFYEEISDPQKTVSPVMSILLVLLNKDYIPSAVEYILRAGYSDQKLEHALFTLCVWLSKWTYTTNLGPLVLAFMKGLENEQHYDILVEVTTATIEPLFKLLLLPDARMAVGPVVLYMLTRFQNSPAAFHRIVPHVGNVITQLAKEQSESSQTYLQEIVNLCIALMEHFPGFPQLYEQLKSVVEPYGPQTNYKQTLNCESWSDSSSMIITSRCSIGKVGLINLGNTCYMNSVLQALFMTKTFRNEVLLYDRSMLPLLHNLQILFALLQHSKRFSLSPNEILNLSRPPGFLPGHQHDSSEFLGYLLDTLHEQEKSISSPGTSTLENVSGSPTVVQQSFGGKTLTASTCNECGTRSERVDNFRELQLSFPSNTEKQSVQSLLEYYLQPEMLCGDNQYHCDKCTRLTDGERITHIYEPPPRLILTLKHFRYDPASQQRTKLLQTVKLDDHLSLDDVRYELYAAVVHCGSSVDSGHYYTFAKEYQEWYKFNDCSVIKTTSTDLCKLRPPETPYILFYGRQDFMEPDNLPGAVLSKALQVVLSKDQSEYEMERRRPLKHYNTRQNRNDEPPPPGCGGGGFSNVNSNMFVC